MEYFKKLSTIRDFLKSVFQNDDISDAYDSDRFAQTFGIKDDNRIYLITIKRSFIDDHEVNEFPNILKRMNIKDYFHDHDIKRIIISSKSDIVTE